MFAQKKKIITVSKMERGLFRRKKGLKYFQAFYWKYMNIRIYIPNVKLYILSSCYAAQVYLCSL